MDAGGATVRANLRGQHFELPSRRATNATHQPRLANSRARPAPMPEDAPVMRTVCDWLVDI